MVKPLKNLKLNASRCEEKKAPASSADREAGSLCYRKGRLSTNLAACHVFFIAARGSWISFPVLPLALWGKIVTCLALNACKTCEAQEKAAGDPTTGLRVCR